MAREFWLRTGAFALVFALSACSKQIQTPPSGMANLQSSAGETATSALPVVQGAEQPCDVASEEAVSDGCLAAWRKALKGDIPGAMSGLKQLDKQYPKQTTVCFMMGQIMEHAGKRKEAAEYYQQALSKSEHNQIYLFKLAESLRTAGDGKAAIAKYKELIELDAKFVPARIGLAKTLLALHKNSPEAAGELKFVLESEPDNQEAKQLLAGIGSAK